MKSGIRMTTKVDSASRMAMMQSISTTDFLPTSRVVLTAIPTMKSNKPRMNAENYATSLRRFDDQLG